MAGRFQFSLRNVFAATAWLAVWGALFPLSRFLVRQTATDFATEVVLSFSWLVGLFLFVCLPFVAIGALMNRTTAGWKFGIVAAVAAFIAAAVFLPSVR
jgi:hypothetical protein